MSDEMPGASERARLREKALSRWDNEGGASYQEPQASSPYDNAVPVVSLIEPTPPHLDAAEAHAAQAQAEVTARDEAAPNDAAPNT